MTLENWLDVAVVVFIVLNAVTYVIHKAAGRDFEAMESLMLATFLAVTLSL